MTPLTRRRCSVLAVLAAWWGSGAPAFAEELTLKMPAEVPSGSMFPIEVEGVPEGATVGLAWKINGKTQTLDHLRIADGLTSAIAAMPDGNHVVTVRGAAATVVDGKAVLLAADLEGRVKVGDPEPPPPPKPLKQLVTAEQAATLSTFYRATLSSVPLIPTPDAFWGVHAARLKQLALDGSEYEKAVTVRFETAIGRGTEKLDGIALVGALESVIKELGASVPPPVDPLDPVSPATAVTYVYEKDETAIPTGVSVGLNRLNREKKIRATLFEEDTVDGDGDVPDQYRVPLTAARQSGLPSLVVTAGSDVLKVVKDPRTEQQVFEAIAP